MADEQNNDVTTSLLEALTALADQFTAHSKAVTERMDKIETKADNAIASIGKRKDNDEDPEAAERVAADSAANLRSDLRVLQSQVNDLVIKAPRARTQADHDAYADTQAKADAVLRAHNERADMPMAGESLVDFKIRLHRPMLRHSRKWGKAELAVIARDSAVLDNVLAEIRADAYEAGIRPVDLPMFQHREIKSESPGGHRISTFHGNGTIFKQLARPARYVRSIAGDDRVPRTASGSVVMAKR